MPRPVDFFKLSNRDFEFLLADLLSAIGFSEVQVQPPTTPRFDIIATETVPSLIRPVHPVQWGVQCKLQRGNVGPDVLDNISDEALHRRLRRVLITTASDFTPRTLSRASDIEETSSALDSIVCWNERRLRQELVRHPALLKKYFGVRTDRLLPRGSRITRADADRMMHFLGEACGVPVETVIDILIERDIARLASSLRTSQLSSRLPSVLDLARSYSGIAPVKLRYPMLDANNTSPYDYYESIEHITTIRGPVPGSNDLRFLTDQVRYRTVITNARPFVFEFVTKRYDWERSHYGERNEYTWQMASSARDLRQVTRYVKVSNLFVGAIRLPETKGEFTPNRIRIEFDAPALQLLQGKLVEVSYTVHNVRSKRVRSLVSSLHAPAREYSFVLASESGFSGEPHVGRFLGGLGPRIEVTYEREATPPCVRVSAFGDIPRAGGVAIYW